MIISELWIMDKDGSNQRPIFTVDKQYDFCDVRDAFWSPNSDDLLVQRTVYKMGSLHNSELWRVTTDGDKTLLSSPDDWAEQPQYSPDGSKIAFIIQGPHTSQNPSFYRLYVTDYYFSDPVFIDSGSISSYSWKNDSQGLIYALYDRNIGNSDLWESSLNGIDKIRITQTSESEGRPSCSYDGNYIVFSKDKAVFITPSNAFIPIQIFNNARNLQWIPNRNLILLFLTQSLDNRSWTEAWIVDIEGTVIKKLAEGEGVWGTSFTSTGDYCVYSMNGNLWLDYLPY